jgi:hypothetical protein
MILPKLGGGIAICWLMAMPLAQSQSNNETQPSKWEFGARAGIGQENILSQDYFNRPIRNISNEYYLGGYATRHFNRRWSLRNELSIILNPNVQQGATFSLGVFPRYRLNKLFSLEAGLEARRRFTSPDYNHSRLSIGAVFHAKRFEFNLRFAPGYQAPTPFSTRTLVGNIQAGVSFRIGK